MMGLLGVVFAVLAIITDLQNCRGSYGSDPNSDLKPFLQPIDVGRNLTYDDMIDDGYLCSRDCTLYPEPRICYYKFVAEQYHAMGPACKNCTTELEDCFSAQCVTGHGIERTVLTFNRMIPGPSIQVCFGDRIIVDVFNQMNGREVTIHWHGELQRRSPWMDGVPYVTQCPIQDISTFRYDFWADTPGSHFYHSHSSLQLLDGLSGALIVRTSEQLEPLRDLYDYDLFSHVIHLKDWLHVLSDDKLPGYNRNKTMLSLQPDTYLINGMGKYRNPVANVWTTTPFAEFKVKRNKKYRFRILGVTSTTCSYQVSFEGHSLLVIATDGYPIEPKEVRSLYMSSGDIYDVVINTKREPSSYWIRVQGYSGGCTAAFQLGVLKYVESQDSLAALQNRNPFEVFETLPFPELNNMRIGCRLNPNNLCLDDMKSLYKAPERLLNDEPNYRFIFRIGFHSFTMKELYESNTYHRHYLPFSGPDVTTLGGMFADTIDNKTNILPSFPLLSEPKNPKIREMRCPEKCDAFCECLNLIKVELNSVIEIVLIDMISNDDLQMDHPFHFHGHNLSILKFGTKEELEDPNFFLVANKNEYPVVVDAVLVPAAGFVVVRIIASNPGFWPLHCHFTPHDLNGMLVIFQVGDPDVDFLPIPRGWPKCGDYLPPIN